MNLTPAAAIDNAALVQQLITMSESRHLEFKRVSGKMVGKALLLDSLRNASQRYNDRFHGSLYLLTSCLIPAKTKTN